MTTPAPDDWPALVRSLTPAELRALAADAWPAYVDEMSRRRLEADIERARQLERFSYPECRECGCTEFDCTGCLERNGESCYWVEPDLCSGCARTIDLEPVSVRDTLPTVAGALEAGE